ncbi:hypothetical protein Unana1_05384 [Umbelopsis nana]
MAARRILKRSGSDSEDEYLGKSSLPVTQDKVIDDDSFVPATGEDYLLMVRRQTRRVPAIVVAAPPPETKVFSRSTLPSNYQFRVEQVTTTAEKFKPKDAWRTTFHKRFEDVKESFSRQSKFPVNHKKLPMKNDKQQWHMFLYGSDKASSSSEKRDGHQPDVNILQRISQDVALKLLFFHIGWLEDNTITRQQVSRRFTMDYVPF